jgi:hypothetical protein
MSKILPKKEADHIYGIEPPEVSNRRVRRYVHRYFKHSPKSFFLEWNRKKMLIDDGKKWCMPTFIRKVSVFMQKTTVRGHIDYKIDIKVIHSSLVELKTMRAKRSNAQKASNQDSLLMVITHGNVQRSLDDDAIRNLIKIFNRDKKSTSLDHRLLNLVYNVIESQFHKTKQYKLNICKNAFFNDTIKRIFPNTYRYLSFLSK